MKKTYFLLLLLLPIIGFSQERLGMNQHLKDSKTITWNLDSWFHVDEIAVYGGGSLMSLVTAEDPGSESTSTSGSIGLNFSTMRINANIFFSYNGKKIIQMQSLEQFGNALMNPNMAGESITLSMLTNLCPYGGVSIRFDAADNIWQLDSTTYLDAAPIVFRAGFFIRPFDFDLNDNENRLDFIIKLHYTHRGVLGDFSNDYETIENQEIPPRGYNGFEFSTHLYFNGLEMIFQYSQNAKGDFINIPGFTGSQVTIGLNVIGDLISLKKKK